MNLIYRPRRLRQNPSLREAIAETRWAPSQLWWPVFVTEGKKVSRQHPLISGLQTISIDQIYSTLKEAASHKIGGIILFGVTEKKDSKGTFALDKNSTVIKAIKEIRSRFPDLLVATDIALDPYTDHGHDGLFDGKKILNDETVEKLCEMSILHAKAGAHIVSPSDMMDGRVEAIREALDEESFVDVSILSYTAKYASCLYGPFRDTLKAKVKGDKKTYQMDPRNRREASRELELDINEGADMVMVKPASWYLDVISDFKDQSTVPVFSYQVSGECGMIELAAKNKMIDRNRGILESLDCLFRAGSDAVITYFAIEAAKLNSER